MGDESSFPAAPSSSGLAMRLAAQPDRLVGVFFGYTGEMNGVRIVGLGRLGHRLREVFAGEIILVRCQLFSAELASLFDSARRAVDVEGVEGPAACQGRR